MPNYVDAERLKKIEEVLNSECSSNHFVAVSDHSRKKHGKIVDVVPDLIYTVKVLERALFKMAEDILRRDLWLSCFDITKGDIAGVVNRYRHDAENVLKRKTRKPLEEETPEQGEEVSE